MKKNNFRGDLTDNSAKKEALNDTLAIIQFGIQFVRLPYGLQPYTVGPVIIEFR